MPEAVPLITRRLDSNMASDGIRRPILLMLTSGFISTLRGPKLRLAP
ncbi:MAG: hypothetical protein QXD44_06895 [Candidatus Nezhaarchaeales archaeon]